MDEKVKTVKKTTTKIKIKTEAAKGQPQEERQETKSAEVKEEFKVKGEEILKKVKELIAEGNARRIIIKDEKGKVLVEIPMTLGAVGVVLAPVLAAVGALAALMTNCTIEVIRRG